MSGVHLRGGVRFGTLCVMNHRPDDHWRCYKCGGLQPDDAVPGGGAMRSHGSDCPCPSCQAVYGSSVAEVRWDAPPCAPPSLGLPLEDAVAAEGGARVVPIGPAPNGPRWSRWEIESSADDRNDPPEVP